MSAFSVCGSSRTWASKLLVLGPLLFLTIGLQAAGLKLASDSWPPFTDTPGKPHVAQEIVHTALQRIGVEAETDILEFSEVMEKLRSGDLDGSAALWWDEDRESFLVFSDPYLENRLVLVGPSGSDVSATNFTALQGRTVGLVGSYSYDIDETSGPTFVRGANEQANLDAILNRTIDYMLVDELVIQYLLEFHPEETKKNLAIGSTPLVKRTLHFAVRQGLDNADGLIIRFNETIRDMQRDGTYNKILRLSWIRVDVDGDGSLEMVTTRNATGQPHPSLGYDLFAYKTNEPTTETVNQEYVVDGQSYETWEDAAERSIENELRFNSTSASDAGLFSLRF